MLLTYHIDIWLQTENEYPEHTKSVHITRNDDSYTDF